MFSCSYVVHVWEVKPRSWIEAIVGIYCLVVSFWLAAAMFRSFDDPYVVTNLATVVSYVGSGSAFLLFGSVGAALLTGMYHDHRKRFHWIWLVLCASTIVSFFWVGERSLALGESRIWDEPPVNRYSYNSLRV